MIYLILLVAFAVFTLLDAVITVVGLSVGLVELNPVVAMWGVSSWVVFRILLLGCMLAVFFASHRICLRHFPKGLQMLKATLFILDSFIGAVVFSGSLAIYLRLMF